MNHTPVCGTADSIYTVDYDRQPFCLVRARDVQEAASLAGRLLAVALRSDASQRSGAPVVRPLSRELPKLRVRRPTEAERCQFAARIRRNGEPSPYLTAVMVG